MTGKTFHIVTLGCKVNQAESEAIAASLQSQGMSLSQHADICIVNTCTVTHKAAMQSRQAIRQARKSCPNACIIATGCYAQTDPDTLKTITELDVICNNTEKERLPDIIGDILSTHEKKDHSVSSTEIASAWLPQQDVFCYAPPLPSGSRTRPFIKIQDGCNAFCTYCIVPHARGRSRSLLPEGVLKHIGAYQKAGYHEVVLTGIHIGQYGRDKTPQTTLTRLLQLIHGSRFDLRIRLSSIEPMELTDDIIHMAAQSDMLCHHFHIPLQSGDNDILQRMHRPYDRDRFAERVSFIRDRLPDAAIGTDVLVGFPDESDTAFENTYELIESLPLTYLHVFPFSPRKGTPAFHFPNPVPAPVIKKRCQYLRNLGIQKKFAFMNAQIGRTAQIVIETRQDLTSGCLKGLTSNYIPVLVDGGDHLKNTNQTVRLCQLKNDTAMKGVLIFGESGRPS
ncbi:MAG: tRNA (N(6)-L-threonylcarbamoyladenosine(37)-C(2))-methylthiotransferase MtaB [Desulfatirhabdiaceae bacterium]